MFRHSDTLCRPNRIVTRGTADQCLILTPLMSYINTKKKRLNSDDRQRFWGLLRRGICASYYRPDCPTVENLVEDADDVLFRSVSNNQHHLLHSLLADKNSHGYDLRRQRHDRILYGKVAFCQLLMMMIYSPANS